ncbi:hypothetical protein FIBSPDRAFT_552020 [Athelia psychrophila]|uniref:Uncharacterized protein n=1 Tax=Athelia psychrophila TaxID=1759441 RepID=A0A166UW35_9AGAM|nr:hypothetical protein FIBSPDRAFT_552020 [Fibularhizoctonia sp. CBS 109695]
MDIFEHGKLLEKSPSHFKLRPIAKEQGLVGCTGCHLADPPSSFLSSYFPSILLTLSYTHPWCAVHGLEQDECSVARAVARLWPPNFTIRTAKAKHTIVEQGLFKHKNAQPTALPSAPKLRTLLYDLIGVPSTLLSY